MNRNSAIFVGITGGIGTGKSTVTRFLMDQGYKVIDTDLISRQLVERGSEAYQEIVKTFGEEILNLDQSIDRRKLGQIVFNASLKLDKLNSILHPKVRSKMLQEYSQYKNSEAIVFADVPLLFEVGMTSLFDCIWLVYAPEALMLERIMARDHFNEVDAKSRIRAQMHIDEKRTLASVILDNTTSLDHLYSQILRAIVLTQMKKQ